MGSVSAQTINFEFDRTRPIEILADRLIVTDTSKRGEFMGHVQVTQDHYKLLADKIIVDYMDQKKQKNIVKRITALDNVRLFTKQEQAAQSGKMVYDLEKKRLTLTQNVLITYDNNTLKGDKIVIHTDSRNIDVTSHNNRRIKAFIVLPKQN